MYIFTDIRTALLVLFLVPLIVIAVFWVAIKWIFLTAVAILTSPWFWVPALILIGLAVVAKAKSAP
jgi:hypothetical protein